MGPRSVTADRDSGSNRLPKPCCCFNGAAVCHRGSARPAIRAPKPATCFNGAAVCHRGSGHPPGNTPRRSRLASMGPRSVTADRVYAARGYKAGDGASMGPRSVTADRFWPPVHFLARSPLQWGRGLSPRIGICSASTEVAPSKLQWGRGLSPRIGTPMRSHHQRCPTRFNGAAVCHRGSVGTPRPFLRACASFNGAAVCHRGSVHVNLPSVNGNKVASMGPRSVTADRRCLC